jgi:hypothetical protein
MKRLNVVAVCLFAIFLSSAARADDKARFDLIGPKLDIRVTRGGQSLPIAQVPNLQPGDKLWVKADLPKTQSNHLLLIVAFLRGTTNEPPDKWFTEIDTWDKKTLEGTTVTVPDEAEQALIFIAPETGGDFRTLRSAVKGRPGLFIRADSDLNEASFEQQRIEHYLAAMKTVPQNDSKAIQEHSAKLASTLALKPNADCFKQPVDQQVLCLTQSSAPVLLEDGHGQNIAEAVSTGPSSDFINAASYTGAAGAGLYSAYVGAVVDLVHLVGTLRTAQYQYIPGLTFPENEVLNVRLNAPPSFNKPQSVIVIGLPAIQKAKLPPIHTHDPDYVGCLLQPKLSIPVEGAPLVYSTGFVHDLTLRLNRTGDVTDIPLTPDAFEGGLVVTKAGKREPLHDVNLLQSAKPTAKAGTPSDLTITGTVRGYWGFDAFEGPTVTLQQIDGKNFKVVGDTQLFAGQDNHLTLKGDGTACIQHIAVAPEKTTAKSKEIDVTFKPATKDGDDSKDTKDTLALDVSMKTVQPGGYALTIQQYADTHHDIVPLTAYTAGIQLDSVKLHTGDDVAILAGSGLKDVASVQIGNQSFTPTGDSSDNAVHLHASAGVSPANGSEAAVKLKDGRSMKVKVETEAARPTLKLLSFHATPAQQPGDLAVTLGAKDDIPLDGKLNFVVQTKDVFPRDQTIEVATADGAVHTALSLASNTLILQDEHTAVASLDPLKAFGQSAFGKLQMRPVSGDGTPGEWTPLGVLVRTPEITAIHCAAPAPAATGATPAPAPATPATCTLDGTHLFLVQSFGASKDFTAPAEVPTGFYENTFAVPTPTDGSTLYLKLRDDPSAVATVTLPTPIPKPAPPAPEPATAAAASAATPATAASPSKAPVTATPAAATPATAASENASAPSPTAQPASTPAAPATPAPKPAATPAPATATVAPPK